jgi:MFS family permease
LAGLTLYFLDIKFVFVFDFITFILAILAILWVKSSIKNRDKSLIKQSFLRDLRDGLFEFCNNKGIVYLTGVVMLILFFVGLLQSLFVPMLLSLTSVKYVGLIQSFSASGMLLGSLFLGIFGNKGNQVKSLVVSLFFTGLFFSLIGVSQNILFIALFTFIFFGFLPFVNTSIEVLIRKKITNKKQGRVWSIISTITYSGSIVAFLVAGFLADRVFEPLFKEGGGLAYFIGNIIGVGSGRGIGFIFIISGLIISFISILITKNQTIKK